MVNLIMSTIDGCSTTKFKLEISIQRILYGTKVTFNYLIDSCKVIGKLGYWNPVKQEGRIVCKAVSKDKAIRVNKVGRV